MPNAIQQRAEDIAGQPPGPATLTANRGSSCTSSLGFEQVHKLSWCRLYAMFDTRDLMIDAKLGLGGGGGSG